jgi:hypothetical protein
MRRGKFTPSLWRYGKITGDYLLAKIDTIGIAIVVTLATSWASVHWNQPSIQLRFSATYPMVIAAARRTAYGDEAYAIKIESNAALKNVIVRLLAISKSPDLSDPLNGFVQPTFGWPMGAESFLPRTVIIQDFIIIGSRREGADGRKHFKFFFNQFYRAAGPENTPASELELLSDLAPGIYYAKIGLFADGLASIAKTLKMTWAQDDQDSFDMVILE